MYDDVLAEPRLDKQLPKCNPDHQMFPLTHHHQLMQLFKSQAQLYLLLTTEVALNHIYKLDLRLPTTNFYTQLKKLPTTTPKSELKTLLITSPLTQLKELPPTSPLVLTELKKLLTTTTPVQF